MPCPPHLSGQQRRAEDHLGQGGDLHRGVPAIHVCAGIGLRQAERLGRRDPLRQTLASLHLLQDQVGGGVEDTAEPLDRQQRQRTEQREDRRTVHHRGLETESVAARRRQVAQLAVGIHHRPLVGGNRVDPRTPGRCAGRWQPARRGRCRARRPRSSTSARAAPSQPARSAAASDPMGSAAGTSDHGSMPAGSATAPSRRVSSPVRRHSIPYTSRSGCRCASSSRTNAWPTFPNPIRQRL